MFTGEDRLCGFGGSEIGAVCGRSPYKTAMSVILEKAGGPSEHVDSWPQRWGHLCEPTILQELREDTGWDVVANNESFIHASVPWAFATPDAWVLSEKLIIQCKAPQRKRDEQWGLNGSGDVPSWYAAQVLWEMDVMRSRGMDIERAEMVVRFGAQPIQRFHIPYDEGRVAWIHETAAAAWQMVLRLRQRKEEAA